MPAFVVELLEGIKSETIVFAILRASSAFVLTYAILIMLVFVFVSCGSESNSDSKPNINQEGIKINENVIKTSSFNERHYGGLTSLNKDETIKKYGNKKVLIWRRSFDIPPPVMESNHPYKNKINSKILGESLKDTFERVVPYYNKNVAPLIQSRKNILIVFHGNSCRALLMKIFNISKKKIINFEVPTGNPLLVRFDENLHIKDYKYLDKKRAKKILYNV